MNRVKKSTFNLLFILRKSKLLKNGEAPICLRITVQGQISDVMVKRSIPVHLWNQAKECSNGKQYKDKELNHIRDFDFYLKTVRKCQHNSSLKHLKNLKKIIRIALANDWMKKDPFYGIQFKHEEKNIEFLTQEELERLIHKEFSVQRLAQVRDIFVFCSFTGLAFMDVQQLTHSHLVMACYFRPNIQFHQASYPTKEKRI